jgi:hypothetical protein
VKDELSALQDAFPGTFVQIGFWPVKDLADASYDGVAAWEWLRRRIVAEFDGVLRPRAGYFMENLAARREGPYPGPVAATTSFARFDQRRPGVAVSRSSAARARASAGLPAASRAFASSARESWRCCLLSKLSRAAGSSFAQA